MKMSESPSSDPWIRRLRDPDARDEALAELRGLLVRGLRKAFVSSDESFADDIAQETLIRVINKLDQFEGRSQFTTWAMSIAVRIGTSQLRRKHYQDISLDEFTADGDGLKIEVADHGLAVGETMERQTLYAKLNELIGGLSDRQQTALRAVLGGMPVEEIANKTGSNRNAVYKLVHDARMKLKTGLESAGYSANDVTRNRT